MKRPGLSVACIALLALAACSPKTEPAAGKSTVAEAPKGCGGKPATDALTPDGWGKLCIGMTKADVIAAVGDKADPDSVGGPDEDQCTEFHPARAPEGLYVMIEEGKLARITIIELAKLKDAKGFGLGVPSAEIKKAYGAAAQASPHQYQDPPAEYIAVWEGGPRANDDLDDPAARGMVYEIDGTGKVGAIHAGGPAIMYVEGCA